MSNATLSKDGGIATPVSVPDGGTGVTSLTDGGFLLGSGTDPVTVTAQPTDGQVPIGDTGSDPVLATISGGTGITVVNGAGTITTNLDSPVVVSNGGTGVTTLTDGGFLFGSGTSAVTSTAQPTNGQLPVGRSGMDPILATISGGTGITVVNGSGTITTNLDTPVTVSNGGTGATTLTNGGIVLGSGTAAVTVLAQATDGQFPIGNSGSDPTLSTITAGPGIEVVNGSGAVTLNANPAAVGSSNLGINYAVGTGIFTVTSQDGSALSSTNKGTITLPSKGTPGTLTEYDITADQNFIDDNGSSQIINNLFGLTSGTAGTVMPFFLYAVTNDAENAIQFMLSRLPGASLSPIVTSIGDPSSAIADDQASFWSFDNITETLFDVNPCLMIGSFRMIMSASDDWTVQTIATSDGIGLFQGDTFFDSPPGQFGAAAGKFFADNGGTAPAFATSEHQYRVNAKDQQCFLVARFDDVNVIGVGGQTSRVIFPYRGELNNTVVASRFSDDSLGNIQIFIMNSSSANHLATFRLNGATGNFSNEDWDLDDGVRITSLLNIGKTPL